MELFVDIVRRHSGPDADHELDCFPGDDDYQSYRRIDLARREVIVR